jgi:arylamine N-acetyltransferase
MAPARLLKQGRSRSTGPSLFQISNKAAASRRTPKYNAHMQVLMEFNAHFGLSAEGSHRQQLERLLTAFAELPYENITKIIKLAEAGCPERARRGPDEVIRNHIEWGTGGTCYSLTCTLMRLVRGLGWEAAYILADRRYGQNTHCALLVWIDGIPHLVDPGYLLAAPIALPSREERIETGISSLVLAPESKIQKLNLSTIRRGTRTYRLTYKTAPVDEGEFLKAWGASFSFDMMKYPLLARTNGSQQIYLRGSHLQMDDYALRQTRQIPEEQLIANIAEAFRISPSVVERAVSVLKSRGETLGKASGS